MQTGRLDAFLVAAGYVSGREKAKMLIENGMVTVNGKPAKKASMTVSAADAVVCDTTLLRFVGRGGYKLEKALALSNRDFSGCVAMDVGASTGGFTDCLLQAGAKRVFSIDVGTDQLHPSLRSDPRVTVLENTDVRDERLKTVISPQSVDVCVIDVSFISLRAVLPSVLPFLKTDAVIITLIKPQFEAGKAAVGKRGVVKDAKVHRRVLEELSVFFGELGLSTEALDFSPVTGGEGNIEFLAVLVYNHTKPPAMTVLSARDVVKKAHETLKGR